MAAWEELPPPSLPDITEAPLSLARTGYWDQWDEWNPGRSWEGEKYIVDSSDPSLRVKLKLHVASKSKNGHMLSASGRPRPDRWTAKLTIEGFELEVGSGRCKTLREAIRDAEAIDLPPKVDELLRAFYGEHEASCVFLVEDGELTPWATTFGRWGAKAKGWPMMSEFLVIQRNAEGRVVPTRIKTSVCGYSATTDDAARELARGAELWTNRTKRSERA